MTVWSRDEIGEYHDGRGNLIFKRDRWEIIPFGHSRPIVDSCRTLAEAKAKVEQLVAYAS